MRKRGFYLLLGTTIVVVAAAAYVVVGGDRAVVASARGERVFPELASRLGDLAWMRIARGQSKLDFTVVGGRWVVVEKGNYPASPAAVRRILLGLAELTLVEPKTGRAELFGRLELDDPSTGNATLVALRDRTGGTAAELIVGKTRRDALGGGADGIYVRRPGDNRAWLARGSVELPQGVTGWLDRRIVDLQAGRLASVTLTGEDGETLVLRRDGPGGRFAIADLPDGAKLKPDANLSEPGVALAALDLDDVRPAAELSTPVGGAATAEYATSDGLTIKVRLVARDGTDWITLTATGADATEAEARAINDRVARWAYAIPAQRAKLLRTRRADLVEPAKGS